VTPVFKSIYRVLNPVKQNAERIDSALKEQVKEFDWSDINFPATDRDIDIFEKQNNSIAINVFGYDGEEKVVNPHRITNKISSSELRNMLYYEMTVTQLKAEAQKRKLPGYKSNLIQHQLIKLLIDSDTVHCLNLLLFSDGEKQHYCLFC